MTNSTELVRQLIALIGPPGQEKAVIDWLMERVRELGYTAETDAKGNVVVRVCGAESGRRPTVCVTAHMDEIALMITGIEADGKIRVAAYGGAHPWKWGEGPVSILARGGQIPGILSFGGIHTHHPASNIEQIRNGKTLTWDMAYIFTGQNSWELEAAGVRTGLRVVLAPSRRVVTELGNFVASYFLDDRADLAVWLMALERLQTEELSGIGEVVFVASASEEVGGDGAQFHLLRSPADICVALEIGPKTPDCDMPIDANPSIWVRDGYAAMEAVDGDLLTVCCEELDQDPHWQYMTRGGSDATCSAAKGLVARPVTLGLPTENSHGYEIMHKDAPEELTRLLLTYLRKV